MAATNRIHERRALIVDALSGKDRGKKTNVAEIEGVQISWERGKWRRDYSEGVIRRRTSELFLEVDGAVVARACFKEWEASEEVDKSEFIDMCDSVSQGWYDFAHGSTRAFSDDVTPFDFGGVLIEFASLHIQPGLRFDCWEVIRQAALKKYGGKATFMVFKAFPLEFSNSDGSATDQQDSEYARLLRRRQAAMYRLYHGKLGAARIGETEWMLSLFALDLRQHPIWERIEEGAIGIEGDLSDEIECLLEGLATADEILSWREQEATNRLKR